MADSAAIAGATAVDISFFFLIWLVFLSADLAENRAYEYLQNQDGWSAEISALAVRSADGATITVVLEKDVEFTLLGPLIPGEAPLHITVTSLASPNVVDP